MKYNTKTRLAQIIIILKFSCFSTLEIKNHQTIETICKIPYVSHYITQVSTEVAYNFNIYLQKCIKVTYNAKT